MILVIHYFKWCNLPAYPFLPDTASLVSLGNSPSPTPSPVHVIHATLLTHTGLLIWWQIVDTQQSVLDLLELSASNLIEPDAQSTDIESDSEACDLSDRFTHHQSYSDYDDCSNVRTGAQA